MTKTQAPDLRLYQYFLASQEILDGVLHSIDGMDAQEWIYTHGVGQRDESLRNFNGVLYEYTIIIESRSHFVKNSEAFLATFETILYL